MIVETRKSTALSKLGMLVRSRVAALGLLLCASAAGQDNALDLLHKMQQALGGADKLAAVQDFDQSVKADAWRPNGEPVGEVRKRVRWVKPNFLRLDQVGPGDTYVLYFNGTSGWEILPDGRQADLVGGELEFAKKYLTGFALNVWVAERIPVYKIASPAPNVVRLSSSSDANWQTNITLDPNTSLPVKEASILPADPAHPAPRENQFREWTTVQGIQFPSRIWVLHNGVKLADITTKEIKLNSGIQPSALAIKPAGLKPEMH